jgi:predicted metal-dependent phosphoesterase TrpH
LIIDLHTHTLVGSDDSFIDIDELVEKAKKSGLDGVCVTDHEWFWRQSTIERFCRELDFLILPGVEMNTEDGHLLVFGLDKYVFGMHRTGFLKQVLDEIGGVMILAHPYRRNMYYGESVEESVNRYSQRDFFDLIDIIETHNGRAKEHQSRFSQQLCQRLSLKGTGGSDAHRLSDIPSCATVFERDISNVQELITELKAGRFRPVDLRQKAEPEKK